MIQITKTEDLKGKTIDRVVESVSEASGRFYLFFTDNTFCSIENEGYDETELVLRTSNESLSETPNNAYFLFLLGIISHSEWMKFVYQRKKETEEGLRSKEISQLKMLAEKYPNELK